MIRQPPKSSLLPYTTLFRSAQESPLGVFPPHQSFHAPQASVVQLHYRLVVDDELPGLYQPIVQLEDRKSTRLNSSHANISYAVFCLKKKHTMHFQNMALIYM